MRSIYSNPYKYAVKCNVPIELAKIACKKQRHIDKERKKHYPVCPQCGSKKLSYEMGSYEEGYGDFIECNDCGETYELDEVENIDNLPCFEWDFDPVVYFSTTENQKEGWIEACSSDKLEDWHSFARTMIVGRRI